MNKTCKQCKLVKPLTEFYKDKSFKSGYRANCKPCKDISTAKWRENNRDKYNENMRNLRATDKDTFKNIDLKRTYGITLDQYNKMLIEQDHKCQMCKRPNPSKKRTLCVDHDHKTGEIRGLLCYGCNRALHALETDHLFDAGKIYLAKYKKKAA